MEDDRKIWIVFLDFLLFGKKSKCFDVFSVSLEKGISVKSVFDKIPKERIKAIEAIAAQISKNVKP